MNKLSRFGAIAILPFLAGCLDLEQGLTITEDGTATLVMEISMSTEMLTMMAAMGEEGEMSLCDETELDDVPETFEVSTEEFERDGDTVCRTTAVGPLDALADEMADVTEGDGTTLVNEGNGIYAFSTTLVSEDAGLGDMGDAEVVAMFEGRTVTFYLTAPRIIETSGEIDGNTARMVIPTLDIMNGSGEEYTLFVRFGL